MDISNSDKALTITRAEFLNQGSDADFRVLINRLLYFSTRLLSIRDGFGEFIGLTGVQFSILLSIKALSKKNDLTVNQLAEHLHFSGSFVTMETGKLTTKGLIAKKRDQVDRRKMLLSVTEKGAELLTELAHTQQIVNDLLFKNISEEEGKILFSTLEHLVVNSDAATLELSHLLSKKLYNSRN